MQLQMVLSYSPDQNIFVIKHTLGKTYKYANILLDFLSNRTH